MFGSDFYFNTIKKYVILFGSLFDDIYIDRVDGNGVSQQTLKVPISYGPKERYMTRALQNPDLLRPMSQVFPRMSFAITNITYDPERKLNTIGQTTSNKYPYAPSIYQQYNPVAFNFTIRLSVICRNTEDGLRIVEQIFPYFTPEWTTTITIIPEMNDQTRIPIIIKDVSTDEHYEGQFTEKQFTTWDLDFLLKGYLFGPINKDKIIKSMNINFFAPGPEFEPLENAVGVMPKDEHLYIQPGVDVNGNPTSILANSIPLANISANSNYGVISEIINDNDR